MKRIYALMGIMGVLMTGSIFLLPTVDAVKGGFGQIIDEILITIDNQQNNIEQINSDLLEVENASYLTHSIRNNQMTAKGNQTTFWNLTSGCPIVTNVGYSLASTNSDAPTVTPVVDMPGDQPGTWHLAFYNHGSEDVVIPLKISCLG